MKMFLDEVITEETILFDLDAATKDEVLGKMAQRLFETGRIDDYDVFLCDVLEREKIESTDMGIGVTIPHGKSIAVQKTSVVIGRLTKPIRWKEEQEEEEKPVFAIFLLAVPSSDENGSMHLELISKVATLLIDDDFVETLRTTPSEKTLLQTIETYLGEM
jgi:fructose PTS system EIIA component